MPYKPAKTQGASTYTYVAKGQLNDIARIKRNQAIHVRSLRERVRLLGPKAGALRLELYRAQSEYSNLVATEKRLKAQYAKQPKPKPKSRR